jgi:N-acetyl-anhydromuramyl-L-alanine amidase AmpD
MDPKILIETRICPFLLNFYIKLELFLMIYFLKSILYVGLTGYIFSMDMNSDLTSFRSIADKYLIDYQSYEYPHNGLIKHVIEPFEEHSKNRNHFDNRDESQGSIQSLILHRIGLSYEETCDLFTKDLTEGRVSAHYLISAKKEYISFVPDNKRAWHAGVSKFGPFTNLNHTSIGIEILDIKGTKEPWLWSCPTKLQMDICGQLSSNIVKKYHIHPKYVLGHADIAPQRINNDPGQLFPWKFLYEKYDVGAWLELEERSEEYIQKKCPLPKKISKEFFGTELKKYGYNLEKADILGKTNQFKDCVKAFKCHFSENSKDTITEDVTREDMLWIAGLNKKYTP